MNNIIEIQMTLIPTLLTVGGAIFLILLYIIAWLYGKYQDGRKEASKTLVANTETKLSIQMKQIAEQVDKIDKKIDTFVSKETLERDLESFRKEQKHQFEKEKLILEGRVETAEKAFENATAEQRGLKRRNEALLGEIMKKFPDLKTKKDKK